MAFLRSLNQLTKQAKEIRAAAPPMEQRMADASTQMQQANAVLAQQAAAARSVTDPAAVAGQAQVLATRDTGMLVDFHPAVEVDLLVTLPGRPAYPVSTRATVPQAHLGRLRPGNAIRVRVNPATPQVVHLDW